MTQNLLQGSRAQDALLYFGEWIDKKLAQATKTLVECTTSEQFFSLKERINLLQEFKKQMQLEIQSGELALSDFDLIVKEQK